MRISGPNNEPYSNRSRSTPKGGAPSAGVRQMSTMRLLYLLLLLSLPINASEVSIEGKWKSSKELTSEFNVKNSILEDRQRHFFDQLMGHMTIEFKNGLSTIEMPAIEMISDGERKMFEGFSDESTYSVIGRDKNTVVLLTQDADGSDLVATYHFDDEDTMWTYVAGQSSLFPDLNIREYFVRSK